MRSGWIKFVTAFLLVFAVFDVCTPESCATELPVTAQSGVSIQGNHEDRDTDSSCQFEEDCLACAHFLPGAHFIPYSVSMISPVGPSDIYVPTLDGASAPPYRPPRA
jgi:hypothetical protein